jgi:hypothetical protein
LLPSERVLGLQLVSWVGPVTGIGARDWMNSNSLVLSEIVLVFFIVVNGLAGKIAFHGYPQRADQRADRRDGTS